MKKLFIIFAIALLSINGVNAYDHTPFSKTVTKYASASNSGWYRITSDNVNVRKGPGKNFSVITTFDNGAFVWCYGVENNGFYKVRIDYCSDGSIPSKIGWVSAKYMRKATQRELNNEKAA